MNFILHRAPEWECGAGKRPRTGTLEKLPLQLFWDPYVGSYGVSVSPRTRTG